MTKPNYRLDCGDCASPRDEYMVLDTVWAAAGFTSRKGVVCLDCLEARLGRPLTLADFNSAPINFSLRFGYKMAQREHKGT